MLLIRPSGSSSFGPVIALRGYSCCCCSCCSYCILLLLHLRFLLLFRGSIDLHLRGIPPLIFGGQIIVLPPIVLVQIFPLLSHLPSHLGELPALLVFHGVVVVVLLLLLPALRATSPLLLLLLLIRLDLLMELDDEDVVRRPSLLGLARIPRLGRLGPFVPSAGSGAFSSSVIVVLLLLFLVGDRLRPGGVQPGIGDGPLGQDLRQPHDGVGQVVVPPGQGPFAFGFAAAAVPAAVC